MQEGNAGCLWLFHSSRSSDVFHSEVVESCQPLAGLWHEVIDLCSSSCLIALVVSTNHLVGLWSCRCHIGSSEVAA